MIFVTTASPAAPAVTTIPGYATEQDCGAAGQHIFQQGGELSSVSFAFPDQAVSDR